MRTTRRRLRSTPKEQAENVTIVDLIRNDLSRVAQPFSVKVPRLFQLEALPTVWQMTSDAVATTREGTRLWDVFAALFPCGLLTGAPKVQAMRQIKALEPDARGVYCGAVGVVRPGGHATFNVPIRTVTVRCGQARCGIGSGITFDAQAEGEWQEWRSKRMFWRGPASPLSCCEALASCAMAYCSNQALALCAAWPGRRPTSALCGMEAQAAADLGRLWCKRTSPARGVCACCCGRMVNARPRRSRSQIRPCR